VTVCSTRDGVPAAATVVRHSRTLRGWVSDECASARKEDVRCWKQEQCTSKRW
jgi:hypothetical protein